MARISENDSGFNGRQKSANKTVLTSLNLEESIKSVKSLQTQEGKTNFIEEFI